MAVVVQPINGQMEIVVSGKVQGSGLLKKE